MNSLRYSIAAIYTLLLLMSLGAWAWALLVFRQQPLLLGTALLAYGFGLRHAVDADHIAAIDNVTRKLMQEGKRPVAGGFFFARDDRSMSQFGTKPTCQVGMAMSAFGGKADMAVYEYAP